MNVNRIPGAHTIPTQSAYLNMTKTQRDGLWLWLKRYMDLLIEVDVKTRGK